MLKRFIRDEAGLELTEYAVMAGLIVLGLVVAIGALSGAIGGVFTNTASTVTGTQ